MENTPCPSLVCDENVTENVSQYYMVDYMEVEILQEIYEIYLPMTLSSSKYVRIIMYIFGYSGNILAFLVWIRKPMLHSSGCYLAALAMSDLAFLILDLLYSLHIEWGINALNVPILCETFTILYLTTQYTSPLLTLGFTTERYIAIKFPLKRKIYCTPKRTISVVILLVFQSLALCGIQGYFWNYNKEVNDCLRRIDKLEIWESWTWSTEMVIFLAVPVMILALNILVVFEIRKSRKIALKLHRILFKTTATTTMLLAASFFFILTTLPVSVAYALNNSFPPGRIHNSLLDINEDPTWRAHLRYYEARKIIYNVGLTHYVINFYLYLVAGDKFRRDVLVMLRCKKSKPDPYKIRNN
ncbi:hypothetical protein ACJMK2_043071 [Sinanodonta woodiana]|uniref:G-protein coupled receptors family 1 profile domain-containing protein n=1 Tax=Sinanodonta woodiana TaxID=1069815 RepID=A0ABD3VVS7_SINWO